MKKRLYVVLGAVLLISSGCATGRISNLNEFQTCPIEKAKYAPTEEQLKRGKAKVVVFALNDNGNLVASQAQLGLSMAGNIEAVLTEAKTVELVDRNAADKLKDEIRLAEMNQSGAYDGPVVADYAVAGSLSNASFTHKFNEATRSVDKKGNVYVTPPNFRYTADVEGILKVYEVPSMKVVKTIRLSDNKGRTEETRSTGRYAQRDDDLVRGAGSDAISAIKDELQNQFAQKAYICEKRVNGSTAVYKVNFNSESGVKPGDKCEIYTINESTNQLTGKVDTERVKVCDAVISDQMTSGNAWIVASADDSKNVKLGDQVQVVYSKSTKEYLKSAGSLMNTLLSK